MFGKKVVVKFKDGKILKGWTANISPNKEFFYLHKHKEFREKDKKGFFIFPIDPEDNNERIFVIQESAESVELKDFNGNN